MVAGPVSLAVILQTGFDTLVEQLFICCSLLKELVGCSLCVLSVEFSVLFKKFAVDVGVYVHNALAKRI